MSSSSQNQNSSRKILLLGIGIVAFCLIYTGLWFYGTSQAKSWIQSRIAESKLQGMAFSCDGLDIKGFPFRVGLFCDSVSANNPTDTTGVSLGALRSAAQVYAPGHAVFEVDGPAIYQPQPGFQANMNWDLMHGSIIAGLDGVDRTSIETNKMSAELASALTGETATLTADHGELHLRRNNNDLDIALLSTGTDLGASFTASKLPAFSLTADMTLADFAPVMEGKDPPSAETVKGQIRQLAFDFAEQGRLALTGPFTRGPDGLISGNFDLEADNLEPLTRLLIGAFPDARQAIEISRQLLKTLSPNGKDARVRLTVNRGTIMLGVIPVGFIPPV